MKKLVVGTYGAEVVELQRALRAAGFEIAESESQRQFFGPATRDALRRFQTSRGLRPSGELDEATAPALVSHEPRATRSAQPTVRGTERAAPPARVQPRVDLPPATGVVLGMGGPSGSTGVVLGGNGAGGTSGGTGINFGGNGATGTSGGTGIVLGGNGSSGTSQGSRRVAGTIALQHGAPAAKVKVRIYSRGFGGSKSLVGEGETDERGKYTVPYAANAAGANIEIHAVASDGTEVQLSRTKFGAAAEEAIDLVAPTALQPSAAEFARLKAAVSPHVGNKPEALRDAVERGKRRDLSLVSAATGWDARAVALASIAFENEAKTGIPAGALYAMSRAGLPTDVKTLARVSRKTVETALARATEAGIIDANEAAAGNSAFGTFSAEQRLKKKSWGMLSAPNDFVSKARVSAADKTAFANVLKQESKDGLWDRAKAAGVSEAGVARLRLQGKLAYLTLNNVALSEHLETKLDRAAGSNPPDVRDLIELGYYDEDVWTKTLRDDLASNDDGRLAKLIPPAFEGATVAGRLAAYAGELSRRVRQMDPNRVTMRKVQDGKFAALSGKERANLTTFLTKAAPKGFRLGQTAMSAFVDANGGIDTLLPGMTKRERDDVRAFHALYSVAPSDEALDILWRNGVRSAYDIAQVPPWQIKRWFEGTKVDPRTSERLQWKARQQAATIMSVFDGVKRLGRPESSLLSPDPDGTRIAKAKEKLKGQYPTLETLFGGVDYCECDHCKSVLSPASYLVDVLHFLDPKEPQWSFQKALWAMGRGNPSDDYEATYLKPFDALQARRPDIANIRLTCENTHTALPYIDIVNEVLEQVAAAEVAARRNGTTSSAGQYASIAAYDVGSATSADLSAEPQNIHWAAYVGSDGAGGLKAQVFPTTLPFDLPLELVRAFLKQLDVPLWRLRDLIGRPTKLVASSGACDGLFDVWMERLGLGPSDVDVLVGKTAWYELYGYRTEAAATAELTNAKTLCRRLGITYKELVELVRTEFVNPEIARLIVVHDLGIDPRDVDRYFHPAATESLSTEDRAALQTALRSRGVAEESLRALWTVGFRERTVVLRSPEVGCDFSQTTIGFARPPSTDATAALALLLRKLNVFVRLKRKLGWSTQDLDRTFSAFARPQQLTHDNWSSTIQTALIYLAHLAELVERTQGRISKDELLSLWTEIPRTGPDSLYARLFLNPAMLGKNRVFNDPLGDYLKETNALISANIDALCQAFEIRHDEIANILAHANIVDDRLNIKNVSTLLRYVVLARALELSIDQLIVHLSLTEAEPLSSLSQTPVGDVAADMPYKTLAFFDEVARVSEAGLDAATLDELCRHRVPASAPLPDHLAATDALLATLSALPRVPIVTPLATDEEKKQAEEAAKRNRLATIQAVCAQLGAPEPLINRLVSLLRDSQDKPIIDDLVQVRANPLAQVVNTGVVHVWFAAAGTYSITFDPPTNVRTVKFGAGNDVTTIAGQNGTYALGTVRAGERYCLELDLYEASEITLVGDAWPTAVSKQEYDKLATAVARTLKALRVCSALALSESEIEFLHEIPGLRLNNMPLKSVTDDAVAKSIFKQLLVWIDLAAARRHFNVGDRLVALLRAARGSSDQALTTSLAALTGYSVEFVDRATKALQLSRDTNGLLTDLADGRRVRRSVEALRTFARLGLAPSDVASWAVSTVGREMAISVHAALKGRYSRSAWRRVAKPIFDQLRKKQRDALVAFLTQLVDTDGKPVVDAQGAPLYGQTQEELYERLLLDPGMEPVVLASRIQLAISSLQLFVQRCLMNLEPRVHPAIIDNKRWQWMSRYRIWEVNRKIFIWPENWLEPEFRDDKTHLFRELEGALLQGDVSDDLVRTALYKYLTDLQGIARLEPVAMYFEPGASADGSIVHVVGRTPNAPHKYFYRKCSHRMWTPWEPVGVEIDGEHLVLTVWRGRMHLFWVTFFERSKEKSQPDETVESVAKSKKPSQLTADIAVDLQLSWVELIDGKWVNRSSTPGFVEATAFSNKRAYDAASRQKFSVHVAIDDRGTPSRSDDVLHLHIRHADGEAQQFELFSKLAAPVLKPSSAKPPQPPFQGLAPSAARWRSVSASQGLTVEFAAERVLKDGSAAEGATTSHPILAGGRGFRLLFPSNEITLDPSRAIQRSIGRLSATVFLPQSAQHIVYQGTDQSIQVLWWTPNGWFTSIPTEEADAPVPTSDPHVYALDDRFILCAPYAADGNVVELTYSQLDAIPADSEQLATGWQLETVHHAATDADRCVGRPLGGMWSPQRGVVFLTADGRLLGKIENESGDAFPELLLNPGVFPRSASEPTGCLLTSTQLAVTTVLSRHIFYRGVDGHIHEIRSGKDPIGLRHTDLSAVTGAPSPAADAILSAYAFQRQQSLHVVYRAADGTIHELWGVNGTWHHNPIGAPYAKAAGDPSGYVTEFSGTQHVVYRGVDDHIHELYWTDIWRENILTQTTAGAVMAGSDPVGYSFERQGTQHVVYRGKDGALNELWWDKNGWHTGAYQLAQAFPDPVGPLITPFFYEDEGAPRTFFVEPSLAERTVHDWEEYVITTEEYVDVPFIPQIIPLIPDRVVIKPSDLTIVPHLDRPLKPWGDDVVLSLGKKGLIGMDGGVRPNGAIASTGIKPKVLNARDGVIAMKNPSLRDPSSLGWRLP